MGTRKSKVAAGASPGTAFASLAALTAQFEARGGVIGTARVTEEAAALKAAGKRFRIAGIAAAAREGGFSRMHLWNVAAGRRRGCAMSRAALASCRVVEASPASAIARDLGMSRVHVSEVLRGTRRASPLLARILHSEYGISVD